MRTMKLPNGKTLEISPMTIGQIRTMMTQKKEGLEQIMYVNEVVDPDGSKTGDLLFEEMTPIFHETLNETFGVEKEAKN